MRNFWNNAFKNFRFCKRKDPKQIFASREIAKLVNSLAESYGRVGRNKEAQGIVYNILTDYRTVAERSDNFSLLHPYGQLLVKMGKTYLSLKQDKPAAENLQKAIEVFQKAEKGLHNFSEISIYDFYVDLGDAWLALYGLAKRKKVKGIKAPQCLQNAQKCVDIALQYNSVYGIEAIQLREKIFQVDSKLQKLYLATFEAL